MSIENLHRYLHVVSGGADILQFLAWTGELDFFQLFSNRFLTCEYVEGHQVHLGVAVLASLGGGHLHNLARTVLAKEALYFNIENPMKQQCSP